MNGILNMITSVVNIFLLPINAIFANLFPNMTNAISNFNTFVNTYVSGTLSYFFSILPPIFRSMLTVWFSFVIGYYTVHFTYITVIKVWTIIQKVKFW